MSLMCDWLTVVIDCVHEPIPSGVMLDVCPDGNVTRTIVKRTQVRSSWESTLQVKTQNVIYRDGRAIGQQLYMDGNFAKFLQGHNVFGVCDIPLLVVAGVEQALKRCEISLYPLQLQRIAAGQFSVKRIDLTQMFSCGSSLDVDHWIQSASVMAKSRNGRPELTENTLYFQKRSSRWAIKFYNKGREVKRRLKNPLLLNSPIPAFAEGKLRVELTLRAKELAKVAQANFDSMEMLGSHLTAKYCGSLFTSYLGRIDMNDVYRIPDSAVFSLPNSLRGTHQLWAAGFNLRNHLAMRTFYTHRRRIKELMGVDIALPPPAIAKNNVVPLLRVIEAKPVEVPTNLLPYMFSRGNYHATAI